MNRIYLDSCIIIYLIEGTNEIKNTLFTAIGTISGKLNTICISDLTRMECRVYPIRRKDSNLLTQYDAFFDLPEITLFSLNREVFDLATELRAEYRINTPDAIHLAAAFLNGCNEFWTNDYRLASAGKEQIQIRIPL